MHLKTIWTTPAMSLGERLRRTREWFFMGLARRLPVRLRYYVAMNEIGDATMDSPNIPATPLSDIIRKLERPKDLY